MVNSHLLTMEASSLSLSSPILVSLSLALASRPRRIGVSKRRLNSEVVPMCVCGEGSDSEGVSVW